MKWLFILPVLLVAFIVAASLYLQPNNFLGCGVKPVANTDCETADAIVVVSGGDTKTRTAAGITLFENGWADTLIFSGAAFDKSGPSNAAAMKTQAEAAGVPASAIIIDETSANTQQNAENSKSLFDKNNFHDVILVTSGYHQRRASLEFNKRGEGVIIRNYPVVNDSDWNFTWWWLTPRGWWLAGGEIVKIIAFYVGVSS